MIMENLEQLKTELIELTVKSIKILEENFDVKNFAQDSRATMLHQLFLGAELELSELNKEDLKKSV